MRYVELCEHQDRPIMIDISTDYGSVEGYVVSSEANQLVNWLENRYNIYDDSMISDFRSKFKNIGFLNNINVNSDHTGEGHGSELLCDFINQALDSGASAILLVADRSEIQKTGFDLVKWYEDNDFSIICNTHSGPLMIYTL